MNRKKREQLLKIGAIAIVALFLLDRIVFTPAIEHWKEQSDHIAELNDKVTKGRQLIARAKSLNDRWAEMLRTGLKDNRAVAENDVYRAISRWGIASRVAFSSLTPLWRAHEDEGYDTLEIRGIANGDQSSLARLLFELETDPLPARVSELEMSTRDTQGKQLAMQLRFSFVHLTPQAAQPPRRGDSSSR
jgi:hypothetical protein